MVQFESSQHGLVSTPAPPLLLDGRPSALDSMVYLSSSSQRCFLSQVYDLLGVRGSTPIGLVADMGGNVLHLIWYVNRFTSLNTSEGEITGGMICALSRTTLFGGGSILHPGVDA